MSMALSAAQASHGRRGLGAELARVSQAALNIHCEGMRGTKHAPRDPRRVLERRQGLAEIAERGAVASLATPRNISSS